MAMALKLKTVPMQTGSSGLPDFMVWNNVEKLPWFWVPFYSLSFALVAGHTLFPQPPRRLSAGSCFAAVSPASTSPSSRWPQWWSSTCVIIDQQRFTGGFNGLTDLAQLEIFGISFDAYSRSTYYLVAICLTAAMLIAFAFTRSKAGLILQAIRDHESRVRYFGYDVAAYQIFAFALSAAIAGLAGMLYTVVMEFASPTFLGVQLSLSVVVWCAVGGRQSLRGCLSRRGAGRRHAGRALGIRDPSSKPGRSSWACSSSLSCFSCPTALAGTRTVGANTAAPGEGSEG